MTEDKDKAQEVVERIVEREEWAVGAAYGPTLRRARLDVMLKERDEAWAALDAAKRERDEAWAALDAAKRERGEALSKLGAEAVHRAVLDDAHAFEEALCLVIRLLGGDPEALTNGADGDDAYRARLVAEAELYASRAAHAMRELAGRPSRAELDAEREKGLRLEGALGEARRALSIAFGLGRRLVLSEHERAELEERLATAVRPAPSSSAVELGSLAPVGTVKVGS